MEEDLVRCVTRAQWPDNFFFLQFNEGYIGANGPKFLIQNLTGFAHRRQGGISFSLVDETDGGKMNVISLPQLDRRAERLKTRRSFESIYVPGPSSCYGEGRFDVILGFTVKGRGYDVVLDRFLEIVQCLEFRCIEKRWPEPEVTKTFHPHVGTVPLGKYLARKRYPQHAL